MRNQQLSLASLGQCFITLTALLLLLLLNASLLPRRPLLAAAHADHLHIAPSTSSSNSTCYAASTPPPCRIFHDPNNITAFPFLTSQACGPASYVLALSHCDSPASIPTWPRFVHATRSAATPSLGPPTVTAFFNPHPTLPHQPNTSNVSADITSPMGPDTQSFGFINLTWSTPDLTNKSACQSPVPFPTITHYLPQSIDLTSFAHSAFDFTPSNIILFFNCTSNSSSSILKRNSSACSSYAKACSSSQKKANSSCYEYTPAQQKLNLTEAMTGLHCENAMFFVSSNMSHIPASRWSPGLIQLSWSTTAGWIAEQLELCNGCLNSSGVCGYDQSNKFQCYCAGNKVSATDCGEHHHACFRSMKCIKTGIAFGATGFAIALSLALTLFCIWKRKVYVKTSVPCSSPHNNKSWMKKPSFLWRKQDPLSAKEMSYQEIVQATESFAERNMLGDGGFGAVYKGILADGRKVAVKRLYHDNYRRMEHFFNEVKVLSNLNHPNLVKLYGFCYEDEKELLLIFEYAPQGTVSDQLHNASNPPMSWKLRLNIACETAEALSYLHNSVSPPIYHRDVKTTNILLDEEFHAKLADFGLSKLVPLRATHVSTAPQGTPGYLDPDYQQCYQLTDKSDVYSLGVVLMELVSAKLAVDMSRERGEINLSTLAVMKVKCGQLEELIDPNLEMKRNPCVERSIKRVVELAFQCLHAEKDERPSMSSVAEILAKICREYADEDAEALPSIHIDTHGTTTTCQSCVSNKPFEDPEDSSSSVFFTSSSNPSSNHSSS